MVKIADAEKRKTGAAVNSIAVRPNHPAPKEASGPESLAAVAGATTLAMVVSGCEAFADATGATKAGP